MTWSARGVIGGMLLAVATGVEADGAHAQGVPPDTVRTLFDGDTIPSLVPCQMLSRGHGPVCGDASRTSCAHASGD